jgi:peptidoglycan/xylan/chitin deacetylase (PgdA/CDA1 family)
MYHRIAEEPFDPWGLAVSPDRFGEHLGWILEKRTALPLREFASRHLNRTLPSNAIALTFDDGYACTAEVAAPLLERFGIPATIFVPAELIERGRPFWWDELAEVVLTSDEDHMTFEGEAIRLGSKNPRDGNWDPGAPPLTPRQKAFHRIWAALRERTPKEIDHAMQSFCSHSPGGSGRVRLRPMSPAQVRLVSSNRIEIGSHALTHPWLTSLDRSEKLREIGESIARCAALTGVRPSSFAYPFGNFDEEAALMVEKAGFECACATAPTSVKAGSSPFALPRIQVTNCGPGELERLLAVS